MITEKNVANLLIVANGTTTQTHSQSINPSLMYNLEGVITTPGGIVVNGAAVTAAPIFKVGSKNTSGTMNWSDTINAKQITSIVAKRYTPSANQVDYIGYNGTSGSIDAINSNLYTVRMNMLPLDTAGFMQQTIKRGTYKSTSSATATAVMNGLYNSLLVNFKREPETLVKFERVAANTSIAALTGTAVIYKLTKGSKTVITYIKTADATTGFTASTASVTDGTIFQTPSTSGKTFTFSAVALGAGAGRHALYINETTYNVADAGTNEQNAVAIAAAINAGTQATATVAAAVVTIRLNDGVSGNVMVLSTNDDTTWANVAVTVATGDTTPVCYYIDGTTSSAATFTLDSEWVGETCYFYEGTTAANHCGILTAAAGRGIKITGVPVPTTAPNFFYKIPRWVTTISDAGTTTISTTAGYEGSGTLSQVKEMEQQFQGNEGNFYRAQVPSPTFRSDATEAKGYSLIIINYVDDMSTTLGQSAISHKQLYIACGRPCTGTVFANDNTGIADVLDGYVSSYSIPLSCTDASGIEAEIDN